MDIRSFFQDKAIKKSPKDKKSPVKPSTSASKEIDVSSPLKASRPPRQSKELIIIGSESEGDQEIEEPKAKKQKAATPNAKIVKVTNKLAASRLLERPAPHPNCLNGKTFALSGIFENCSRDDCIHLIKVCGGSITNSVTRNTNYLVLGSKLENGNDPKTSMKYKDAMEKNVQIISQSDLYDLIKVAPETPAKVMSESNKQQQSPVNKTSTNYLWVDKYAPKSLDNMIGNIELGKRLGQWLHDWNNIHVKKVKKVPLTNKLSENRGAKCVLLSGPPGIGKTTIATLVSKHCGFECIEFNASDTRSKKILKATLGDILGSQALNMHSSSTRKRNPNSAIQLARRVVIMDEVDGMSGGDRGGTAELIQLIKKSKTPVICICNDRQSTKVRSLATHSYDLRMRRPTKTQIAKRLLDIGTEEGLQVEKNAMEEAVERCGNDIRQSLMQMQKWKMVTNKVTYADLVGQQPHEKDDVLRLNPFSATQQIFQQNLSFAKRNEAYFVDYDLLPLMIQENYVQSIMSTRKTSDEKLEAIMKAASFIAEGDIVSKYVRMQQRWDLLTKQAALNVGACIYASGFLGHPEFSRWLGKNSSANKSKRLLSELSIRMRSHASGSRKVIRLDYVPYMKEILLTQLASGEEDCIGAVVERLDACEISREDLTESMESFKFPGVKRHSYADLNAKDKASFTRSYNKAKHTSQALVELALSSGKKIRGTASAPRNDELPIPSDAETEESDDAKQDDADLSKFMKSNKKRKATKADDKSNRRSVQKRNTKSSTKRR